MLSGRLLSVEVVDVAWLRGWAPIFRDDASPWKTDDRIRKPTDLAIQAFAKRALPALLAMRGVSGAGEEDRALVRRIDPRAKILERFRRATEWQLQRWLVRLDREQELGLEGLAALGPLPPAPEDLQRWFVAAETKREFLEQVAARWSGSLEPVTLPHYVTRGRSTSYAETSLADVRDDWTEEEYDRRRKATAGIVD